MKDEIIQELWRIKDGIAQDHGYDLDALIAYLRDREKSCGHQLADRGTEARHGDTPVHEE